MVLGRQRLVVALACSVLFGVQLPRAKAWQQRPATPRSLISISTSCRDTRMFPSSRCGYQYDHPSRYSAASSSVVILRAKRKASQASPRSSSKASTSGFGGAATEPCACGSAVMHHKCCGRLHHDSQAWANASASQVVRARYTAYAKRHVDFIVQSTHPNNPNFDRDVTHWKETIESNCYDNFLLNRCIILDENEQQANNTAIVKFLAHMTHRETRERTAFVETSTFERDATTGAWLYRDGVITSPDAEEGLET